MREKTTDNYLLTRSEMYNNDWAIVVDENNNALLNNNIPLDYELVISMSINGDILMVDSDDKSATYKIPKYANKETNEMYLAYLDSKLEKIRKQKG